MITQKIAYKGWTVHIKIRGRLAGGKKVLSYDVYGEITLKTYSQFNPGNCRVRWMTPLITGLQRGSVLKEIKRVITHTITNNYVPGKC